MLRCSCRVLCSKKTQQNTYEWWGPGCAAWLWGRAWADLLRDLCRKKGQPQLRLPVPKQHWVRNNTNIPLKSDYFPGHAMIQVLSAACRTSMSSTRWRETRPHTPSCSSYTCQHEQSAQQVSLACAGLQDSRMCGREGTDHVRSIKHHKQIPLELLWDTGTC